MGSAEGAVKVAANRVGLTAADYEAKVGQGLKWCHAGRHWQPVEAFARDASRSSGLSAKCGDCAYPRKLAGPSKAERQRRLAGGEAWCRRCKEWLPAQAVNRGICNKHRATEARERYAQDQVYRQERRQHAHARSRGVEPVPAIGREAILEAFEGRCAYCLAPATTWDHIVPISRGGQTTPGNMAPCCVSCNSSKGNRDMVEWITTRGLTPHPALEERLCLAECGFLG